jgi:hypothetical protein
VEAVRVKGGSCVEGGGHEGGGGLGLTHIFSPPQQSGRAT